MYYDCDYKIESDAYKAARAYAGEHIVMVGKIGYYYPACVWIGDSGKLYCTHDYDDAVMEFDFVASLIHLFQMNG